MSGIQILGYQDVETGSDIMTEYQDRGLMGIKTPDIR